MKSKIELARMQIDSIDRQMIELFKQRMNAVKMVVEHKIENNLEVIDLKREEQIIKNNLDNLNDSVLEDYYLTFFNGVLASSKEYQKDIKDNKNE